MSRRFAPIVAFTGALLLLSGCVFDPYGVGSTGESAPGTSTGSVDPTTGATGIPTTTAAETTSGDPAMSTSGDESTSGGSTGAPSCPGGCAPAVGWTVVGAPDEGVGFAVTLDGEGDVIVAGERVQMAEPSLRNIWAGKFAGEDGVRAWEAGYGGKAKRDDFARGVAVTGLGEVVVVGASQENDADKLDVWVGWLAPEDGALTRWSNLGTTAWDGMSEARDEQAAAVGLDAGGDLYLAGTRCVRPCEVPDAWAGRFDAVEEVGQWSSPMLVYGTGEVRALAGRTDGLVLVGTDGYDASEAPWRSRVRELDGDGAGVWSALPEPGPDDTDYEARAVVVAADGRLFVVGREVAVDDELAGFIRVYDPASRAVEPVAERRGEDLGGTGNAVAVYGDGVVVGGGATGSSPTGGLWFGSFDAALEPGWRVEEDEPATARGLAVDGGDVIVLGVIARTRGEGERLWLRKYLAP